MSVVEEFSGIDVEDILQLRKKKLFLFCFLFVFLDRLLHNFYVFDLGLPSEFVVDNET